MKKLFSGISALTLLIILSTGCADQRYYTNGQHPYGYNTGSYQGPHRAAVTPYGTQRVHISPEQATQNLINVVAQGLGGNTY